MGPDLSDIDSNENPIEAPPTLAHKKQEPGQVSNRSASLHSIHLESTISIPGGKAWRVCCCCCIATSPIDETGQSRDEVSNAPQKNGCDISHAYCSLRPPPSLTKSGRKCGTNKESRKTLSLYYKYGTWAVVWAIRFPYCLKSHVSIQKSLILMIPPPALPRHNGKMRRQQRYCTTSIDKQTITLQQAQDPHALDDQSRKVYLRLLLLSHAVGV